MFSWDFYQNITVLCVMEHAPYTVCSFYNLSYHRSLLSAASSPAPSDPETATFSLLLGEEIPYLCCAFECMWYSEPSKM
ncbi:hypothetical protein FKM82_003739 [Ascaphus truei]